MIIATAEEQYKLCPEMRRDEVLKLVQWIHQQPHMPDFSELEAIFFFHACKYMMEVTKRTIDINLTVRAHSDIFQNLDLELPEMKKTLDTMSVTPLPKKTPEGYKILLSKLTDLNASNFNSANLIKLYNMTIDYELYKHGIFPGLIIVIDMTGFTLGHLARLNPSIVKTYLFYLQNAVPVRLVGFHYINIVPIMDKVMAFINPFLNKELKEMIQLHSSMDTFYEHVSKDLLPSDLGGSQSEISFIKDEFYGAFKSERTFFLEHGKRFQINEKLRPSEKPFNINDLMGVAGNFKKLDID